MKRFLLILRLFAELTFGCACMVDLVAFPAIWRARGDIPLALGLLFVVTLVLLLGFLFLKDVVSLTRRIRQS
jgi:hypothetical protein